MANSQYEYVKQYEQSDVLLRDCWIVVRIDGIGFTKFTAKYQLDKPNDTRAIAVMNSAAESVMSSYSDICFSYGVSDEYSFLLHPATELFNRRASKINSSIVSLFTAAYVLHWQRLLPDKPLHLASLPSFDSRCILYPTDISIKDYFRWRQVDCHINNLYNTCFWKMVKKMREENKELSEKQARDQVHVLMNTTYAQSSQKNELLFTVFGVNYNDEPVQARKGTIILWKTETEKMSRREIGNLTVDAPDSLNASSATASSTAVSSLPDAAPPSSSSASIATAASSASSDSSSSSASSTVASPSPSPPPPPPASSSSSSPKRHLLTLSCDLIADHFWTNDYPNIIPYVSWQDQRVEEKKRRKKEMKEKGKAEGKREKKEKQKQKPRNDTTAAATTSSSTACASSPIAAAVEAKQ